MPKDTNDLILDEIKATLPTYAEEQKVDTKVLSFVSPILLLLNGRMVPTLACSVDGRDEKMVYTNFLETLESNGYDRTTKTFK
jgi:hypothetical protein